MFSNILLINNNQIIEFIYKWPDFPLSRFFEFLLDTIITIGFSAVFYPISNRHKRYIPQTKTTDTSFGKNHIVCGNEEIITIEMGEEKKVIKKDIQVYTCFETVRGTLWLVFSCTRIVVSFQNFASGLFLTRGYHLCFYMHNNCKYNRSCC